MMMTTMRSMKTIVTRKNPNIYSQTLLFSSNTSTSSSLGGRQRKAQQNQMEQKPADQRKVFLGVSLGLVVCAIPFLFKTIQKRELNVANMRDGNSSGFTGSSSSDSSNRDEKEDARKSRLSFRRKQSWNGCGWMRMFLITQYTNNNVIAFYVDMLTRRSFNLEVRIK